MHCQKNRARALLAAALLAFTAAAPLRAAADGPPALLVFAAASLNEVLGELASAWEKSSGVPVRLSFAASSVLARQIEAGGRADVFVCADERWMDYLQAHDLLEAASRRDLVSNRLVLIAPSDSRVWLKIAPGFGLAAALGSGRLAVADPDSVPAGRYARSALASLGVWQPLEERLARADNVRGALMFVARGETPLGIVYATDARIDPRVRIVDVFPPGTHPPIAYPAAATKGAGAPAAAFVRFLSGPQARDIWLRFGFQEIAR